MLKHASRRSMHLFYNSPYPRILVQSLHAGKWRYLNGRIKLRAPEGRTLGHGTRDTDKRLGADDGHELAIKEDVTQVLLEMEMSLFVTILKHFYIQEESKMF